MVVAAPPISEAAETQILCAAADGVVLVIDSSASRVHDAADAVTLLQATSSCDCATGKAMSGATNTAGPARCRKSKLIGTVLIEASTTATDGDGQEPGIGDPAGRPTATTTGHNGKADADTEVVKSGVDGHGARA